MRNLSRGQVLIIVILVAILVVTIVGGVSAWNTSNGVGDAAMSVHGWIALALGTLFSLLIGCGLMALMFFSSRSGYDEQADPFRDKRDPL